MNQALQCQKPMKIVSLPTETFKQSKTKRSRNSHYSFHGSKLYMRNLRSEISPLKSLSTIIEKWRSLT